MGGGRERRGPVCVCLLTVTLIYTQPLCSGRLHRVCVCDLPHVPSEILSAAHDAYQTLSS